MANSESARTANIAAQLQDIIESTKRNIEQAAVILKRAATMRSPLCISGEISMPDETYAGGNVVPFPFTSEDAAGFYVWDIQADMVFGDRAIADIFNLPVRLVTTGLPMAIFLERALDDDRPIVAKAIYDSLISSAAFQVSYRVNSRWGILKVVAYGRCFRRQDGEPLYWSGIIHQDDNIDDFDAR